VVTTITQRASDFTDRDFDSWILELRSRASTAFPGWTDFNTVNFGTILLEMFAHTLDVVSFTQDQQHLERFVVFANLRRSMILLGKNVGFSLPGATVATVDLEITFADGNPRAADLVIPKGTVITTADLTEDVEFDLTADVTIAAGLIQTTTASAENARERSEPFVADGTPTQRHLLGFVPFVDGSADGNVEIAATYDEVDDFFNSGPTDRHFFVDVDENDRLRQIVEKPEPEDAPSTLAVVGRYLLTPTIFDMLETTGRGAGGEIQLTDAIADLLGREPVYAIRFCGQRYDCGNKLGYIRAMLAVARRDPEIRAALAGESLP